MLKYTIKKMLRLRRSAFGFTPRALSGLSGRRTFAKCFCKASLLIAAALIFTGCKSENENKPVVISVRGEESGEQPTSTIIQSSVRTDNSDILSNSGTVESANSSSSASSESSTASNIGGTEPIISSSDETSKNDPVKDDSIMYVNRQKYGKKEPYPDAERSGFYDITQMVRVVSKTDTGYYLLDNGDYILCDYLSETDDFSNVISETVSGRLPNKPPKNTNKLSNYDPQAALQYAKAHWNKDRCFCAEFGSECLTAGGAKFDLASSTSLYNSLVKSNLGYAVTIDLNEDGTANLPEYAFPGDVIFYYCTAENMMIHTAIYNGDTKDGLMKAYAHNPNNNGGNAFSYRKTCTGSCNNQLKKIVLFCFYRNSEEMQTPANVPKPSANVNGNDVKLNWDTDFLYRSCEVVIVDKDGNEVYRGSAGTDKKCKITFNLSGEYTAWVEFKIINNIVTTSGSVDFSIGSDNQSVPESSNSNVESDDQGVPGNSNSTVESDDQSIPNNSNSTDQNSSE